MLAYGILLHRDPLAATQLIEYMQNEHDVFFVHVDQKSLPEMSPFISHAKQWTNVHFVPSLACQWGDWSLVEAELRILNAAVGHPGWRSYVNLSGSDFPVKNRDFFAEYLITSGKNFIDASPVDSMPVKFRDRIEFPHRDGTVRLASKPRHIRYAKWVGSQWHTLQRDFCEWMIAAPLTKEIAEELQQAAVPDEYFFQAALLNGPFADTLEKNPRRYIRWEPNASNPATLTLADAQSAYANPHMYFARKFEKPISESALGYLKEVLGQYA